MDEAKHRYLYVFDFSTPDQWLDNVRFGTREMDQSAFFIEAHSEEAALAWGRSAVRQLLDELFGQDARLVEVPEWRAETFPDRIEPWPLNLFSPAALVQVPVVKVGELPRLILD